MEPVRLGVDVGGTFTDLAAVVGGEVITAKVPSRPGADAEAVAASLAAAGLDARDVAAFAHGTTVATNALLERRGARTALVTTHGFRDLIEIGRQDRPSLYDLTARRPEPLVPRPLRFTVRERTGPDGELERLDEESVAETIGALRAADVDAVAVCLLFGFLHPAHERRVGEAVRAALPSVRVALSSEVLPEVREYERLATTAAEAYLGPRVCTYLDGLAARAREEGLPPPLVVHSGGGALPVEEAARRAASLVLSGPAAGVVGAAFVARSSGYADVLTLDMGGTSTDVAPVVGGEAGTTTESSVGGVPIRFPSVDVHSVSAGGGSVAWVDEGGALRVGPRSAGANPGPAAYGRGGAEATVTDANLVLGLLRDGAELGGSVVLNGGEAREALSRLGERARLDAEEAARGVVAVANAEMVRALRVISVERGLDPREFALCAFGGAGPLHACALADELGMRTVLVPKASGVLSALGLAVSDVRRETVRPFLRRLDALAQGELERAFADVERQVAEPGATLLRRADARYRGQSFELTVDPGPASGVAEAFHAAHERRYGYRSDAEPVELVSLRVASVLPVEKPELREGARSGGAESGRRRVDFGTGWADVRVLDRAGMGAGSPVDGPAVVELAGATCAVPPGWGGAIDDAGTLVLERR